MGCVDSKAPKDPETKNIDEGIKEAKLANENALTILLLGPGNSGKSTFARQLCHLYPTKQTDNPIEYRHILLENTLQSAQVLITRLRTWKVKFSLSEKHQNQILEATRLTQAEAKIIESLGQDDLVVKILEERGDEMMLCSGVDGALFFFKRVTDYVKDDYIPTLEDTLKARRKTTGIIEYRFNMKEFTCKLIDVGGQVSERKKWLSLFETVRCIIFLVAINEYDLALEENENKNRLVDAITLWHQLTGVSILAKVPFILFLNKSDLFLKKIEAVPLSGVFDGYEEWLQNQPDTIRQATNYEQSWRFIANYFTKRYQGQVKLSIHLTSAVDTTCCSKIWKKIVEFIKESNLHNSNLL